MSIVTPERPVDAPGAPTPARPNRNWWHVVNSVIALGAVTIGVIALTRDPATKTVEVPAPATTIPGNWVGDPGPVVMIPSAGPAGQVPAPATTIPGNWVGDPGPVVGIPSAGAAGQVPVNTGGVPSDKYADRVPAYQYDISQQHAPVSPTGPVSPSWMGPR